MKFKKFYDMLLAEDVVDYLKSTREKINTHHDSLAVYKKPHEIIDHFAHADPSVKKKNLPWIIDQYHAGHIRQEDSGRVHEAISNYVKYSNKLGGKKLSDFSHISHLEDAVEGFKPKVREDGLSGKKAKRMIKHEGSDELHNDNDLSVHKLHTKEAACHYGAGTRWCTAAKTNNMFDAYNKQGPLFVIHDKKNNKKYQFHFETHQFMNEKDEPVRIGDVVHENPKLQHIKHFSSHPDYGFLFKSEEEQKAELEKIFK